MARKPRYPERPATHACDECGEIKPFDEYHFPYGNHNMWGLRFKCRVCVGITYRGPAAAKEESPHRYCRKCGARLSIYNTTKECWSHSVEDKKQNAEWTPVYQHVPKYVALI